MAIFLKLVRTAVAQIRNGTNSYHGISQWIEWYLIKSCPMFGNFARAPAPRFRKSSLPANCPNSRLSGSCSLRHLWQLIVPQSHAQAITDQMANQPMPFLNQSRHRWYPMLRASLGYPPGNLVPSLPGNARWRWWAIVAQKCAHALLISSSLSADISHPYKPASSIPLGNLRYSPNAQYLVKQFHRTSLTSMEGKHISSVLSWNIHHIL